MTYSELVQAFLDIYGGSAQGIRIFEAPGRVNLIGEHIDYNGGHVFPMALELKNIVIARQNGTNAINMATTSLPDRVSANLGRLNEYKTLRWGRYQCGVATVLQEEGYHVPGCDLLYHGTVPYGAGLSSSASIEVATALCLVKLGGCEEPVMEELAVLSQRAENSYVGMNCGIMDQFISAVGKKGHAIFLDCATLEYRQVPLDLGDYTIVITNTNAPHKLTDSAYNKRRSECGEALRIIRSNGGVYANLCDITEDEIKTYGRHFDEAVLYRRARHCVTEERRTRLALEALTKGDLISFGALLCEGNLSMRDDYEATGPELDAVFDIALKIDGVIGSRMTGGGFGGCNISVVKKESVPRFQEIMNGEYCKRTGYAPSFYRSDAAQGAREVTEWE